jgi:hypothetical protein
MIVPLRVGAVVAAFMRMMEKELFPLSNVIVRLNPVHHLDFSSGDPRPRQTRSSPSLKSLTVRMQMARQPFSSAQDVQPSSTTSTSLIAGHQKADLPSAFQGDGPV